MRATRLMGWVLGWATLLGTAGCTVDPGFMDGQPCAPDGSCATGYTCVAEPCGEGYMCPVCRRQPAAQDGGTDGGDADGGGDAGDAGGDGGDGAVGCDQTPPDCLSLPDCQPVEPECIDGVWVCDTGYEPTERSCDGLDNDCDGQTDAGLVCPLAGDTQPGLIDGTGRQARFDRPSGLLSLPSGELLVADSGNHAIRQVAADGTTTTLAGNGESGWQDGNGAQARFRKPSALAMAADGRVLVADQDNHRIRLLSVDGQVTTLAGSGFTGSSDGPALEARFAFPAGVITDADEAVLVADTGNHCLRRIAAGQVEVFAGRCGFPGLADGAAEQARFNRPHDLLLLADGNLAVSEESSHRIRLVAADGQVSTLAGDGEFGWRDGSLAEARFANPAGLAAAGAGTLWLADAGNHRIRLLDLQADAVTSPIGAGVAGAADGPPALVELHRPAGVALTAADRLVIADTENHLLRVYEP